MTRIGLRIECDGETCGSCGYARKRARNPWCRLFEKAQETWGEKTKRLPECREAEKER